LTLLGLLVATPGFAQPALLTPDQLVALVAPVALYPDPLLAQVLAAATYHDQAADAAHWADAHRDLKAVALAEAMLAQSLTWNPTVQALLPFPMVLDTMASDPNWVRQLGDTFLSRPPDVLDAIQDERAKAKEYGYLRTNERVKVSSPPGIEIDPVNRAVIVVPAYDPAVVFSAPSAGAPVASAIHFDTQVEVGGFQLAEWHSEKFQFIGGYFQAWGWGFGGIDWPKRTVIINGKPWQRTWSNQGDYVHPYPELTRVPPRE
jgi:hypothetical protein